MFAYTEVTLPDTSIISDEVTLSSQDQTVALSGKKMLQTIEKGFDLKLA